MVYTYPDIESGSFHSEIYKKEEIIENKAYAVTKDYDVHSEELCNNKFSKDQDLLPQQKLLGNYLAPNTPYNGLLVFHGTGVGKTCTAITIAEKYKTYLKRDGKKVIVICSSDIMKNFKQEIISPPNAFPCTGETYIKQKTLSVNDSAFNKAISEHYEFKTYYTFAQDVLNMIKKIDSKEDQDKVIRDYFSDSLIIIDEAQNVRQQPGDSTETKIKKKDKKQDKQNKDPKVVKVTKTSKKQESKKIVEVLERVTEQAYNLKLVLLTATPMYDSANEIIWMLNLIQRVYKHPLIPSNVIDSKGNFNKEKQTEFKKTIQGKVSFLKGENPYTFPFRLYDTNAMKDFPLIELDGKIEIPKKEQIRDLKLTPSYMTDDYFNQVTQIDSSLRNNFYSLQRQLHNVCWSFDPNEIPSNLVGESGLKKFFNIDSMNFTLKTKENPFDSLDKYSPKINTIVNLVESSTGVIMIYSSLIYSGIIPVALALENLGYSKYSKHGGNASLSSFKKKKSKGSYVMFTSDTRLSGDKQKLIKTLNSKENTEGQIIKVILISPVGGEGITLKCVREVHLLEPHFNMSEQEQATGRAIRTCSHIQLPLEKRNCTVYHHVNCFPKKHNRESVDIHLYRNAELKNRTILTMKDFIQKNAFDCAILKNINYFSNDIIKDLPIVDSQNKNLKYSRSDNDISCVFTPPQNDTGRDTDTYNISDFTQILIIRIIKDLFRIYYAYSPYDLYLRIKERKDISSSAFYKSINHLVYSREVFSNEFGENGVISYEEKYGVYIFQRINKSISLFSTPPPFIQKHIKLTDIPIDKHEREKPKLSSKDLQRYMEKKFDKLKKYSDTYEVIPNLDTILAQMVIDGMSNNDRIKTITDHKNFSKHSDKFNVALESYINNQSLISIKSSGNGEYINNGGIKTKIEKETNPPFRVNKNWKIYGYTHVDKLSTSHFHVVFKKDGVKPRGSKAKNIKKDVMIDIINQLIGKKKYVLDLSQKRMRKIGESFNAENKEFNVEYLCSELEVILRYFDSQKKDDRKWFYSSYEYIINNLDGVLKVNT